MPGVRVAAHQLAYPPGESKADRVARVLGLLRQAPEAELLVLPELWDVGYFAFDEYGQEAQTIEDGPAAELAKIANKRDCTIVGGSVLERSGDQLYNTVIVVDADGSVAGTYRKMHLFGYRSREVELLSSGRAPAVVTAGGLRIGLATCFDLRFPEQFAAMRDLDADLLVVPAAWPSARVGHWEVLVQARAIETQTPLVAVNGIGDCYGIGLAGRSMVVGARGEVLADGGTTPGWLEATLDPDDTTAWRHEFPLREASVVG